MFGAIFAGLCKEKQLNEMKSVNSEKYSAIIIFENSWNWYFSFCYVTMKVNIKFQDIFSEPYEFQHCGF